MGFLRRLLGRSKKLDYPPALQPQIDRAMANLQELTAAHDGVWQIGQADWQVDQDAGTITFTSPAGTRVTAPVQIIGTYNTADGSWLWGWDHPSVDPALAKDAQKVLAYGKKHSFDLLTTRKLNCPEAQCWDFTALACLICKAQGGYRGPADGTRVFMTFGKVKLEAS